MGYRSIDTAQAYHNEEGVGRAVKASGLPREDFFLTTKVWVSNGGEKKAAASIDASLEKLQTDYIDLLLIHQPFNDYYGTWRAMEAAYRAGKVRAIGVSNFFPDRLVDLCQFVAIRPMVNQVETHALCQQTAAHAIMEKYGVVHQSWGPFAEGRKDFFQNPVLVAVGAKHGKTVAQVALRFLLQSQVVVIPKSVHKERMEQNIDIWDFSLSDEDMREIAKLDLGQGRHGGHPGSGRGGERLLLPLRPGHRGVYHQPGPLRPIDARKEMRYHGKGHRRPGRTGRVCP